MTRLVVLLWVVMNSVNELIEDKSFKTEGKHERSQANSPAVQNPQLWVVKPGEGRCELPCAALSLWLETKGSLCDFFSGWVYSVLLPAESIAFLLMCRRRFFGHCSGDTLLQSWALKFWPHSVSVQQPWDHNTFAPQDLRYSSAWVFVDGWCCVLPIMSDSFVFFFNLSAVVKQLFFHSTCRFKESSKSFFKMTLSMK